MENAQNGTATTTQRKKQIPSKWVACFLGIFFGWLGLHQIYIKNTSGGVVMLLITIFSSFTIVVPLAVWAIGFLQGLSYAFWDDKAWADRFSA